MSKPRRKPQLGSAPIFIQVLALALLSVMAAQAINFLVVLWLPDPPPAGINVVDAARALKGEPVVTGDGKRLRVEIEDQEPPFAHDPGPMHDPMSPLLTQLLARALETDPGRVRVAVQHGDMHLRHSIVQVSTRARDARLHAPPPGAEPRAAGPDAPQGRRVRVFTGSTVEQDRLTVTITPDSPVRSFSPSIVDHMASVGEKVMFPSFSAAWKRPDGKWAVLRPARPWLSPWQMRLLIGFVITALMLAPLAWWTARRVTRPIHLFAGAADRLGRDPNAPPLTPTGPAEVRTAVAAFNDMQDKLKRYVDDRTAMVAAIAHDLRTPLMRLRFRIEAAPEEVRARTVADIEQMDAMISAALAFARGEAAQAERVRLDLSALVASVVDDMADTGTPVTFEGGKAVLIDGDALGLKRLVSNLVVNAVKFGERARVALKRDKGEAVLTIEDDGPGLADDQLERVFDPFYRGDASRNAATGGFGLGLSAARAVARAHDGDIRLENREGGGLRAVVRLPLA